MSSPFSSLHHRNYRLFWLGQCVSLVGTWMQRVAQGQLVVELTGSSLKLGLVAAAQFAPMLTVSLFAGVLADRLPKRRILLAAQSLLMLQAVILAVLTRSGAVRYWHVLSLALLMGIINSFEMPTRQAYLMELVGREDVVNAVALYSAVFNVARIVGPAVAGLVMAYLGLAACFALNALSFLAVILGLYLIDTRDAAAGGIQKAVWAEMVSGFKYILGRKEIRDTLILLGVMSVFTQNFNVLIPAFNAFTLENDPRILGFLWSAMGAGSLGGAVRLAFFARHGIQRSHLVLFGLGLCLAHLALAGARSFQLAAPALVLMGLCSTSFNTSVNSTLQTAADDAFRGRVMSVYALVLAGLTPFGGFLAGVVAEIGGPPAALAAGAGVGIAGIGAILLSRRQGRGEKQEETMVC